MFHLRFNNFQTELDINIIGFKREYYKCYENELMKRSIPFFINLAFIKFPRVCGNERARAPLLEDKIISIMRCVFLERGAIISQLDQFMFFMM